MPHLQYVWPTVSCRLHDATQVLLLFDYDGTLAPIVPQPDLAILPTETKNFLVDLNNLDKYILGVVSGRSLKDISARVGIEGIIYAGNHGLEIRGPNLNFIHKEAIQLEALQSHICEQLRHEMAGIPGVIVENKGLSLSVHYRLTPDDAVEKIHMILTAAVSPLLKAGNLKITHGKKVLEVRPNVSWGKGQAIAKIQKAFPQASLTIFFGDDLSDEDGFEIVKQSNGITVFVGPVIQPTKAMYNLNSPMEVTQTLKLLASHNMTPLSGKF
jgi:trehalose 6-phosphate phosphatase